MAVLELLSYVRDLQLAWANIDGDIAEGFLKACELVEDKILEVMD